MLFVGAGVAAWGSAQAAPSIWAMSLAFVGLALRPTWNTRWTITPLAVAVWALGGWTFLHTAFLSKAYSPAGLFDPMFLLAGFALGRSLEQAQRERCYVALGALIALLAIWSVVQLAFGEERGHALFEAPSTHATIMNAALTPALVAVVVGAGWRPKVLAVMLFAGTCATGSRSGAIALAATLGLVWISIGARRWRFPAKVAFALAFALIGVLIAGAIGGWGEGLTKLANLDSAKSRLELYELAWSTTTFGLGIGYLAFRYVLEIGRAEVPSYREDSFTYFVHNDYLQTMLELGIPGIAALVAIVVCAVRAYVKTAALPDKERHEAIAVFAGVLTILLHAAMDFPLHLPLCLLLLGFGLGILDRLSTPGLPRDVRAGQAQRLVTLVLAFGLTTMLARSVAGEAASTYAVRKWRVGETRAAAYGFELARRLDSRDWRHHLYAGQFWYAQAADNKEPEQARLADAAFATAMLANPLEPSSVLARALTQVTYRSILPSPASPALIRAWAEQALLLAPLNRTVRREHEQILRRMPPQ